MKKYHELVETILKDGSYKEAARENMPGTRSIFGYQFRHDMTQNFPIITTKKMFFRGIVAELLWFLRGDTNIKYLVDQGVSLWNQDAYNYYCKPHVGGNNSAEGNEIMKFVEPDANTMATFPDGFYTMFSFEEFESIIKNTPREELPKFGSYTLGDCGFQYGKLWRELPGAKPVKDSETLTLRHDQFTPIKIDQIKEVVKSLQSNPYGRRHVVDAWNPATLDEMALHPCHALFQFNCRRILPADRAELAGLTIKLSVDEQQYQQMSPAEKNLERNASASNLSIPDSTPKYYLDCQLYQRSADVILGVPFNISSYALLTHVMAKLCNMVPGDFIHTFGDVHIYDNHLDAVKEQMDRDSELYPLPTVTLSDDIDWNHIAETLDFSSLATEHFKLLSYQSYPKIKADLKTGMVA